MASSSYSCCVCDLRHINKPSIVWCMECDEGLCKDCQEHHSLSKGTRNHNTIAVAEYMSLPSDVLKITQNCDKHQAKFIIYCRNHECPCCGKCVVENHKECRDIENLDDVIKNVKTSNAVYETQEILVEVAENLQKIRQHQQKNLSTLKKKRKQIQEDIQKTRTLFNNHLDKIQEDLIKQLYAVEEKEQLKIRQMLSTLEKKEKEISDNQRNIVKIKQHGTHLQLFLSIKQIEEDVFSKDGILNSLIQEDNLKNHSLEYKINSAIQNILDDIKSFGDINIEAKPCEIVLSRKKTRQAQIMVPVVNKRSIENIKLKKNKTINTESHGNDTYGCCILSDGRMVFTYFLESTVKVFSNTGFKTVKIPGYPFDIVDKSEDNTLVAKSAGSITIIDLEKEQIKKTFKLDSCRNAISLKNRGCFYNCGETGIQMVSLDEETIMNIVNFEVTDDMPCDCYTAAYGKQIYHTNWVTNVVTCYDQQGKPQWTFRNTNVLKCPRGICEDNDGNVFVVGSVSNNVVVISPDGRRYREVLGVSDGVSGPFSLSYNSSKEQLLVANLKDMAQLFDFV